MPAEPAENQIIHTRTTPEIYTKIKLLAREMRRAPTPAEDALWQRLRGRGVAGLRFRRQHFIDRVIVDFYCQSAHLVIEVDGPIHDQQTDYDATRTEFLESLGLRVMRFTNNDVLTDMQSVLEAIIGAAQNPHPPAPSLRSGEGEQESE
jgi:very-short-patch-repair endonuclease